MAVIIAYWDQSNHSARTNLFAELGEDECKRSFDPYQFAMSESHSADYIAEEVAMITEIDKFACKAKSMQER